MNITVVRIPPDGPPSITVLSERMETLQDEVGGFFETVDVFLGNEAGVLVCNEDGRRLGLPPNPLASRIAGRSIVGHVVVTGPVRGSHLSSVDDDTIHSVTMLANRSA